MKNYQIDIAAEITREMDIRSYDLHNLACAVPQPWDLSIDREADALEIQSDLIKAALRVAREGGVVPVISNGRFAVIAGGKAFYFNTEFAAHRAFRGWKRSQPAVVAEDLQVAKAFRKLRKRGWVVV
jgi:hypothetical protein